ncbi:hypothetical protein BH10PSE9_BH10PSE9_14230 [soil metagenome]
MRRLRVPFVAVLAWLCIAVGPTAADPFMEVRQQIEGGDYTAARAYAVAFGKTERAKAINLAFVDALVLRHQGRLKEAAAALRALLAQSPAFDLVRLELAQTLYLMGDYEAATHHLEMLAAAAGGPAERGLYDRFLADIRSKRPWGINAFVSLAPSTNINNGLDSDVVLIGGIPFTGATAKKSGVGAGFGVDGFYRWARSDSLALTAGGGVTGSVYGDHAFDGLTAQSFLEVAREAGPWRVGFGAGCERVLSGWEGYSWGLGPQFSVRRDLGRAGTASATVSWRAMSYDTHPELEGSQTRVGLRYRYAFDAGTEAVLSGDYSHVTAAVGFNAYDGFQPALTLYRELTNGLIVDTRLAWEYRRYAADFPLLGTAREDNRFEFNAGLTFRNWSVLGLAPRLQYGYRLTRSNIELFNVEAHDLQLTFTRRY